MSDDYFINNDDELDESLNQENIPAIDGQIGMEELLVREDENKEEDSVTYIPPMDNQISLEDFVSATDVLKEKAELLNGDKLGIFSNEKTEKLDDFFKTEDCENENNKVSNSNQNDNFFKEDNTYLNKNNEEDDDYESPKNIGKSLSNFFDSNDVFDENEETEMEENLSVNDLIGSETKIDLNNNNKFEEQPKNAKLNADEAFLGLNEGYRDDNLQNLNIEKDGLINSNDTEKEEGLSVLEDNNMNNNNNFNNENNQNYNGENTENNSNNYDDVNNQNNGYNDSENNQNYGDVYNNSNIQSGENFGDNNSQNENSSSDSFDNQNNDDYNSLESNNSQDDNGEFSNNYINDTNNENDNSSNSEAYNNNFSDGDVNNQNVVYDNNSNNDGDDDNALNNFFSDETYGGNASSEDTMFSFDGNVDSENNFENEIDNNNNEVSVSDNEVSYNSDDEIKTENETFEDSSENNNNDNMNDEVDDSADSDTNFDNASSDDSTISDEGDNYQEAQVSNEETFEESDNTSELDNKEKVKLVEKQVRAKAPQKENYFENEENVKIIEDVDAINKDYEDVEVVVGKDAFADCDDASLETGKIEETEVSIKEKVYNENDGQDVVDGMLYKNLDTVLHESMIPYSEHVILDRALPRVEDGLKPVQRRILYSMLELGVTPDKPYRKSARIVGDCLGKYHPHGDASVYDAMVRMAQPFNTNMLLVSGHGNFGSIDGDGAAAMRYTEARLAPISMELLRDLDKNTVKWGLNFDDTLKEPEILPGRFPNLLVNGATGIAVGLATNIPPHNLAEAIDGVVAYLNNPSIKLKEMLKIIKGPDFPTGAFVLNSSELYQAYETGRGKIYMRAKMHIESNGADKRYIVITELPYQVNKSSLLQKIALYKDEDRYGLGGISEVRDESDREGLRAVLRLKKDADIKAIYKSLLKNTELQSTFGINMVAIANGKPKQMGLLDIISYYAEYQREIIYRRSKFELEQAKEREHILSGLIIAIKNIDAVIKIIKTSQNTTEAKKRLKEKFNLSDRQAQAILDMRLAKLTSLEVYKLEEELKRLRELIKKLTAIIASKKLQKDIVKEEMLQIKRQYKQERKTKFAKAEEDLGSAPEPKEEANQKVVILKSVQNNFKCVSLKQYNYAQKDVTDNSTLLDTHTLKFETETNNTIIAFSSLGNCFKVDVKAFTLSRYRDKGVPEQSIFKELSSNETIVAIFDNNLTNKEGNFIFLTKYGMIKKTAHTEYSLLKKYYQGMKLKDDDEIIAVYEEPKNYTYIFVTKQGMVLNAENTDVPLQGRISGGVKGINLANNDYCVGVGLAGDGGEILAVTNKGFTKRVLVSNVDKSARYRKGLKFFTFTGDNGRELIYASVVTNPFTLGCVDNENNLHYRSTDHIPIESRTGKGKAVDRMKKSLNIVKAFAVNN